SSTCHPGRDPGSTSSPARISSWVPGQARDDSVVDRCPSCLGAWGKVTACPEYGTTSVRGDNSATNPFEVHPLSSVPPGSKLPSSTILSRQGGGGALSTLRPIASSPLAGEDSGACERSELA